ncbi:hypothetical protein Fcan01_16262 [Folsomia candida]|uniref:Uncharacterized protein n=1 Tax=Folsomia candida TaxID=158441 RepID=A0A226DSI7_FOLCA|nr:hypothetical protein Fcan01_16262 [Folsomia candida]
MPLTSIISYKPETMLENSFVTTSSEISLFSVANRLPLPILLGEAEFCLFVQVINKTSLRKVQPSLISPPSYYAHTTTTTTIVSSSSSPPSLQSTPHKRNFTIHTKGLDELSLKIEGITNSLSGQGKASLKARVASRLEQLYENEIVPDVTRKCLKVPPETMTEIELNQPESEIEAEQVAMNPEFDVSITELLNNIGGGLVEITLGSESSNQNANFGEESAQNAHHKDKIRNGEIQKFLMCNQNAGENVSEFFTRLENIVELCRFGEGDRETLFLNRFVLGLREAGIRDVLTLFLTRDENIVRDLAAMWDRHNSQAVLNRFNTTLLRRRYSSTA